MLILAVIFWSFAFDWLSYRFPPLRPLLLLPPRLLVENSRVIHENLAREMISKEDLMCHLRKQGVDDLAQVKLAHVESDGRISVIKRNPQTQE